VNAYGEQCYSLLADDKQHQQQHKGGPYRTSLAESRFESGNESHSFTFFPSTRKERLLISFSSLPLAFLLPVHLLPPSLHVQMISSATLPQLPPSNSSSSFNDSRPKRRLSDTTQFDLEDDDEGVYDEEELHTRSGAAGRSKRSRISQGGTGGGADGEHASPKQLQPGKALTEKEKESRRVARMIRNRSAFLFPLFSSLLSSQRRGSD
jgi:hypothetical protein